MGRAYMGNWEQELAYLDRQKTINHAMEMDRLDRANQMTTLDKLLGSINGRMGGAGGGGASVSGKLGLGDAETRLAALLDDPDSINKSAAYKFRVGQGQEAVERSLGARGMLGSGNRLTELTKYGQDMGSQEYDNQFGRLSSLLGNYQASADRRYGSDLNAIVGLGGNGSWGGKTGDIWSAYTNNKIPQTPYSPAAPNPWPSGAGGRSY